MRLARILILLAAGAACCAGDRHAGSRWTGDPGGALAQGTGNQGYPGNQNYPGNPGYSGNQNYQGSQPVQLQVNGSWRPSGGPGMGSSGAQGGAYLRPGGPAGMYLQGPGTGGMYPQPGAPGQSSQAPARAITLAQWFNNYDQIRHAAQMSAVERQGADGLLSRGLSVLMPGDEKAATNALLTSMVRRYQTACNQLRALPQINQTANLQHAYYDYFATAGQLFSDYVQVQNNLFVADAQTGQPLASSLIQRKQMLEGLEHQCKTLDAQTRAQYGIAPYPW